MHRPRRLNIDAKLIARAAARMVTLTGEPATFRSLVACAVERELPRVVALLKEAGLTHRPGQKARPREVDDAVWARLGQAEGKVAADKVELLRACLERLARH